MKKVVHKCRWFWGWTYSLVVYDGLGLGRLQVDEDEPGVGYLLGISVLPEYQGQGIGREVLGGLEEIGEKLGLSSLRLTSEKQHPFSLGWYLQEGYQIYTEDDNLWYLSKILRP